MELGRDDDLSCVAERGLADLGSMSGFGRRPSMHYAPVQRSGNEMSALNGRAA